MFIQILIGGLRLGVVYALLALGFSLIYSASGLMLCWGPSLHTPCALF
jgi:branched-chain amino acid transport system permease protein